MKKTVIILISIFFMIVSMLYMYMKNAEKSVQNISNFNKQYEQYIDKEITGTELATIMNKAMDNNEKHEIKKNYKDVYIEDNKYCLKIIVKFLESENYYEMEALDKLGINQFISNFNLAKFKVTKHKYNEDTNRIGQIIFEQTSN